MHKINAICISLAGQPLKELAHQTNNSNMALVLMLDYVSQENA